LTSSSDSRLRITVEGYAEIRVYDAQFHAVARGTGSLDVSLAPGIYQVTYGAGSNERQDLVALKPGETRVISAAAMQPPATAPLPHNPTSDPAQVEAAHHILGEGLPATPGMCRLVVFSRTLANLQSRPPAACPFSVVDRQFSIVPAIFAQSHDPDGWRASRFSLPPGGYALRASTMLDREMGVSAAFDQALWLSPGWDMAVFLATDARGHAGDTSIYMAPAGELVWPPEGEDCELALALEAAINGLTSSRALVPRDQLRRMFNSKRANPMLAIIAAHCMLLNAGGAPAETRGAVTARLSANDRDLFVHAASSLRSMLGETPDVRALMLADGQPAMPCDWPPMVNAAYALMLSADARREGASVLAESPAEQVATHVIGGSAWTRWHAEPTRTSRRRTWSSTASSLVPTLASVEPANAAEDRLWSYVDQVADLHANESPDQLWDSLDPQTISANTGLPFHSVVKGIGRLKGTS
jgi:hypothetical protein